IGYAIDRPDMVNFDGFIDKQGLYAPAIRYHDGLFYVINTNVGGKMNFYVTATNPAGPWSDPIWLPNAPGIDPSLMWDDDGKCYYTGHMSPNPREWPGHCRIWTQELDLENEKLVGRREYFTEGHANNAAYTEGPHLYKINGKYLLMVSEGGTGLTHSLTVHHSDSLWGPYITDPINPVITHRHLGRDYPIQATGHGDLVQTQNGEWWCVLLGKRLVEKQATFTRETFLAKVDFEGQTPIFNRGIGKVLPEQKRPDLPWTPVKQDPVRDQFNGDKLALKWCFIRIPMESFHSLENGELKIKLQPEVMDSLVNSSLIIQRILHHKFEASTKMSFKTKKDNEQAGLAVYRAYLNHYSLMKGKDELVLYKSFKGVKTAVATIPYKNETVYLKAVGDNLEVQFSYGETEDDMKPIGDKQDLKVIADGHGNQFNGPGIGMYATSNGKATKNSANFEWFDYKEKQ
ncbi:glycoside hydrolase family 43 protein, partial [Bacteroidales bacterium]|nr:glycoside hydrolase family 43 protein [Bacteroidales bacterium]